MGVSNGAVKHRRTLYSETELKHISSQTAAWLHNKHCTDHLTRAATRPPFNGHSFSAALVARGGKRILSFNRKLLCERAVGGLINVQDRRGRGSVNKESRPGGSIGLEFDQPASAILMMVRLGLVVAAVIAEGAIVQSQTNEVGEEDIRPMYVDLSRVGYEVISTITHSGKIVLLLKKRGEGRMFKCDVSVSNSFAGTYSVGWCDEVIGSK